MPVPHSLSVRAPKVLRGVNVFARARLPSRHGEFEIVSFIDEAGRTLDDVAIVRGELDGAAEVTTRIHSECLTGDVFGSYRCDCRDQLELAMARISTGERGIILYLRQEGRGIGIAQKVRAYQLQQTGLDTVEANLHLGFDDDLRDYSVAAAMLHALGVVSVVLHTNNLRKIEGLRAGGVEVHRREAIIAESREQNVGYLATKRDKSGHLL
ncbi:MAG TPA: GTP cyclohydrolase II [Nannocystis sp.]|jgi:GTP cyclohydrolase II